MANHIHYAANNRGRDFIVGDVHGCFDQLVNALRQVDFNATYDRLFSVGDMIDRGQDSFDCIDLIYEDWFKMVKGNHEELMEGSLLDQSQYHLLGWMQNGGAWHLKCASSLLMDIATKIRELPLVISVGEGSQRFNIAHAEVIKPTGATNTDIDNWTFLPNEVEDILWGRSIANTKSNTAASNRVNVKNNKQFQTEALSPTYVGHSTVCSKPVRIKQQIFIDTGCHYGLCTRKEQFTLTMACPQEQLFYCYNTLWKRTIKIPYKDMEVFN
jgi:serine/threonine protein phosphatase 1